MKTHQGKQTSPIVTLSMDKTLLPTMGGSLGLASRMATTNILRSYHPLQHYNLGSQISAYGENVDQP